MAYTYTPADAVVSKNAVLEQIAVNVAATAESLTRTVYNTLYYPIVAIVVFIILVIIVAMIYLAAREYITPLMAIAIGGLLVLATIVVGLVILHSCTTYAGKEFREIANIYLNFISSERTIEIIDGAAAVYLANNMP